MERHIVRSVRTGSIAEEMEIEEGDELLFINGREIKDIFDYRYLTQDSDIELVIRKKDGEEWELLIEKDPDEDLGIEFSNPLMDDYRSCSNKCIFCFIDQMPPGMRETLYFKDDDSRLSFLQGNYVTLTNMSEDDIERVIRYNLSPINVSFHTTNPSLRCRMLNNRFAGDALKKADRLFEAGITMNGQIVLCKGINDGEELNRSISDLSRYIPVLESLSVVPVGLSKYRDSLFKLESFGREDAVRVLELIHSWQEKLYREHGTHFVHAGDEFYILAGQPFPGEESYDGYLQYENGVGMARSFIDEFEEALFEVTGGPDLSRLRKENKEVSLAGGMLMRDVIGGLVKRIMENFPNIRIHHYPVKNEFFGENITVCGLLTGRDIISQLKGKTLGSTLFLPENLLRYGTETLLDDMTISQISEALGVRIGIMKTDGRDFLHKLIGA